LNQQSGWLPSSPIFLFAVRITAMKKHLLIISLILLCILAAIPPLIFFSRPGAAPQAEARSAMQSNQFVTVTNVEWITFTPTDVEPVVGFIFYPGAKVNEQAYAPVLQAIAAEGFLVVDVPMPGDLAFFGKNKAEKIIAALPEINTWVIGGHSLGGVIAAEYAAAHPDQISGLALWASYPPDDLSLVDGDQAVISISGTRDGLSPPSRIIASAPLLPGDTLWVPIEGGNHAQFGDYGPQPGDLPAAISAAEQQEIIVQVMVEFLSILAP
jgi:hypothetical protein